MATDRGKRAPVDDDDDVADEELLILFVKEEADEEEAVLPFPILVTFDCGV